MTWLQKSHPNGVWNTANHSILGVGSEVGFGQRAGVEESKSTRRGGEAARADEQTAIRRKHETAQSATKAADGEEFLLGGNVPEFKGAVFAGAGNSFAVG